MVVSCLLSSSNSQRPRLVHGTQDGTMILSDGTLALPDGIVVLSDGTMILSRLVNGTQDGTLARARH